MRCKRVSWFVAFVVAAFVLNWARIETGGLRNLVSRSYWQARSSQRDLYDPQANLLRRGRRDEPVVALTFDDGPHPGSLTRILQTLKANNVRATFFLVGHQIAEHPGLVREIVNEGHEVGNHTFNHFRLTDLSREQRNREIEACDYEFMKATGRHMSLFRAPGMKTNAEVAREVRELGYTTVGWTDAGKDFESEKNSLAGLGAKELARRVTANLGNGSIILLHDSESTADALPLILKQIRAKRLRVVPLPEMLASLPQPRLVRSNAGPGAMAVIPTRSPVVRGR